MKEGPCGTCSFAEKETTMTKFDEQMKRWEAIIGDTAERTQDDALKAFFRHLSQISSCLAR